MKVKILLPVLISCFYMATAQQLPEVVLPTPESSALFKYMDYPVSHSTGVANISVPLYTIKQGDIEVPVSLQYHSSGRKVYDETGAIGLGWTLVAGGRISRTIYGEPDDNDYVIKFPVPWKYAEDINASTLADSRFLQGVVGPQSAYPITNYDTEYDVFSYMASGISGKFILRDENNIKVPVLLPKRPHKVLYHKANTQFNINYFDHITVIDEKGTTYRFGKSLKDETEYYETSSGVGKNSWMLTEIVSADKVDTIYFKYQNFSKSKITVTQQTTVSEMVWCDSPGLWEEAQITPDGTGTLNEQNFTVQRLVEIKWRVGKMVFNLSGETDKIESIEVLGSAGPIKTIDFARSTQDRLTEGNAPTEKLNEVAFKDKNGKPVEKYIFDYYPTVFVENTFSVDGRRRDLWGYYNAGPTQIRPYIENIPVQRVGDVRAVGDQTLRVPNESACKSGVLKKIHFPTGGSTEFLYEQNKFINPLSPGAAVAGGGLRVRQAITDDGNGNLTYKTYKYGTNEQGSGEIALIPSVSNMMVESRTQHYAMRASSYHLPQEHHIVKVYHADVLPAFTEIRDRPIYYSEVTEYHGTELVNTGKTIYKYDVFVPSFPQSVQGLFSFGDVGQWKENSLVETWDYKNIEGVYEQVKLTKNEYQETVYPEEKIWGLRVAKYYFVTPDAMIDNTGTTVFAYYLGNNLGGCYPNHPEIFRYGNYTISVGKKELIRTTETLFENGTPTISNVVNYTFNSNHLPSTVARTASTGDQFVEETKYPFDFPNESIHAQMLLRNMVNYPVEVSSYRNLNFLSATKTQYKNWGGDIIKPELVFARQGTNPYEERIRFHSYTTDGSIESVSKDGGPITSYLWDNDLGLPIAEVRNVLIGTTSETVPAPPVSETVQVPGLQSQYLIFEDNIEIEFTQDVTLEVIVSKPPNSQVPDHYYAVPVSLFNKDTEVKRGGTFCLTCPTTITITSVPPGIYALGYQYSGDIGEDNEFPFTATLTYSKLKRSSNVHYNGFEASFNAPSTDSYTGRKSRLGPYKFFGPYQPGQYTLTFWTKVVGSNDEWSYNEQPINITSTTPSEITVGNSNVLIDEVRLHPVTSLMTTFTYDPLIGMTYKNDPNNQKTQFQYDDFGRLQIIRDSDKNIITLNKYHYQNED